MTRLPVSVATALLIVLILACGAVGAAERPVAPEAYAAFCMGVQAAESGRPDEAVTWFQKTLALDASAAPAHVWLGAINGEQLSKPQKAREHFIEAIRLAPENVQARHGLGKQLLRDGQFEAGRSHLLAAIEMSGAKGRSLFLSQVWHDLAIGAELANRRDDAAQYYRKAADASPAPAYILLRLSRVYRDIGKNPEAVATLREVIRQVPNYSRVYRELADTQKAAGQWAEALETLQAYMSHPDGPGEQNHLLREAADVAARAGLMTAARKLQEKVLLNMLQQYTPESAAPRICEEIAATLEKLGRLDQAEPYLKKAVEATDDKSRPATRAKLAALYARQGKTDDAVRELELAIQAVEPRVSVRLRTQLCEVLETARRYDPARKALEEILNIPGAKAAGHAELGLFFKRRGDFDRAAEYLREAIKLAETHESVRYRIYLSIVYGDAKRDRDAEQVLIEARKLFPDSAPLNNALGWFYAERGQRLDEALELVRKALAVSPDNPHYLDSLGWRYFRQGLKKEALEHLLRAAALTDDSVICDHLGDVYFALGQPEKAATQWRRSLELDPNTPGVREKLDKLNPAP